MVYQAELLWKTTLLRSRLSCDNIELTGPSIHQGHLTMVGYGEELSDQWDGFWIIFLTNRNWWSSPDAFFVDSSLSLTTIQLPIHPLNPLTLNHLSKTIYCCWTHNLFFILVSFPELTCSSGTGGNKYSIWWIDSGSGGHKGILSLCKNTRGGLKESRTSIMRMSWWIQPFPVVKYAYLSI